MSTRAEQHRYSEQRRHPDGQGPGPKPKRGSEPPHENQRAARKAVYELEPRSADGHASRKSTRGSANHARSDHGEITRVAIAGRAPEAVHERAASRAHRSHGHAASRIDR